MIGNGVQVVVVAHHSRLDRAKRLPADHIIIDDADRGALWGHTLALEWCSVQNGRCIVMEDDALPVPSFRARADKWLAHCPNDLVSFYLGTGRPPQYQSEIKRQMDTGNYVVRLPQLIHGVCYSVPAWGVCDVLRAIHKGPADFAIGKAWRSVTGRDVVYPAESLVDHDDLPSVEKHPDGRPRIERRKAWKLAA